MMGNNHNNYNQEAYGFQTQIYMLDNRLELKTAQSHCFNVAGRMLCAAEHLSYLLKNKKLLKKNDVFGYYNSFQFANTTNIEELKSNMIEQMDNFSKMKRKFKEKFDINLILPLKKEGLEKFFTFLTDGLETKYKKLYNSMLNLLINDKNKDYQVEINNYYETFENLKNQKLELDPTYFMKYYPTIENNIRNLRKEVRQKFEKNKNFMPTMHLNEKNLKIPMNQNFIENYENSEDQKSESIFKDDSDEAEPKDNFKGDSNKKIENDIFIDC